MAVEAVLVVGDDHIGPVAPQEFRESGGAFLHRGLPEGPGGVVARPAHHPGVGVVQHLQIADLQDVTARLEFLTAHHGDGRRIVPGIARLDTPRSVTATAVGTRHENRADAFRRVPREDPSGSGGLVVGVGVYCHERQGPVSHETVLLQKYVSVRVRGGRMSGRPSIDGATVPADPAVPAAHRNCATPARTKRQPGLFVWAFGLDASSCRWYLLRSPSRARGDGVSDPQGERPEDRAGRPLTVLPHSLSMARTPTPKQMVTLCYDPDEFEEFVKDWVPTLQGRYTLVERQGGSGDHGIDVAGSLSSVGVFQPASWCSSPLTCVMRGLGSLRQTAAVRIT